MASSIEILCFYAHEDELLLNELQTHLNPLQRQGLINVWNNIDISGSRNWEKEFISHLNTAQVILFLISPYFLNWKDFHSREIQQAIERHEYGEAQVIPIILRPVPWQTAPFDKLQALNTRPIISSSWHNQNEAFSNVAQGIYKIIEELATRRSIEFSIELGDVTSFDADVLALKYAQEFFGTDEIIAHLLSRSGIAPIETLCPDVGGYRYVATQNCIQARHALFVGVPDISGFNYQDIQVFGSKVLNVLSSTAPATRHLVMTIHGAGFGLDEIEAFISQFRGYLQAIQSGLFPLNLEKITIIDRNLERVHRLRQAFDENFSHASFVSKAKNGRTYHLDLRQLNSTFNSNQRSTRIYEKGVIESPAKSHVFVAMPFKKDMDDVFYYGIQQPVRAAGFICERVDQDSFIGDILDQVKKKIETAAVVIAELSGANPNVYLEIGYAWGKGRPTILLMKNEQELLFDVRGQRCLKYERIRDLEESLKNELKELISKGFIE